MIKTKRRNTYLIFITIGVLAILGITLASAFSASKTTDINVYPVMLDTNIDLVENLQDVVFGETIVNGISFSKADTGKEMYVRAELKYYKYGTLSDEDKRFLLAINYDDVQTFESTTYKWVRGEDGYYYLTDLDGNPLKVTGDDNYIFCESITYQGAKLINNDTPAPLELKLKAEIQAINAKNATNITLSNLTTLFNTYFEADSLLGYIVTFDTAGAGFISAQTFLNNGLTLDEPAEPSKLGYKFMGWSLNGTDVIDITNRPITENITFIAVWSLAYTVTYYNEDLSTVYRTNTIIAGDTLPIMSYKPINQYTKFVGWSLDKNKLISSDYIVSGNISLYPLVCDVYTGVWTYDNYTLTIYANGAMTLSPSVPNFYRTENGGVYISDGDVFEYTLVYDADTNTLIDNNHSVVWVNTENYITGDNVFFETGRYETTDGKFWIEVSSSGELSHSYFGYASSLIIGPAKYVIIGNNVIGDGIGFTFEMINEQTIRVYLTGFFGYDHTLTKV